MDLGDERLTGPCTIPGFTFWKATLPSTRNGSNIILKNATSSCPWWPSPRPSSMWRIRLPSIISISEMNLQIVKQCVKYHKRVVFPSRPRYTGPVPMRNSRRRKLPRRGSHSEGTVDLFLLQAASGPGHLMPTEHAASGIYALSPFNWIGPAWIRWIRPRKAVPASSPSSSRNC